MMTDTQDSNNRNLSDSDLHLEMVKGKLSSVSDTLCLAKWTQVTIHLGTGLTHSCHHPIPHKIPISEIKKNPSALHNTAFKKKVRKMMLEGKRHHECHYCWDVEDAAGEHYSDRINKSATDWSMPYYDKIVNQSPEEDINPSYVEISFGNECNFSCSYCYPQISSSIWADLVKNGPYWSYGNDAAKYEKKGLKPYGLNDPNPYLDAFWEWWPSLSKDLKVFRITGGEPLINPNTFRTLEYIDKNPLPELELNINSNFCVPDSRFKKFVEIIKKLLAEKKIKSFVCYSSVDTFGEQAEYIRHGLNYNNFWNNVEYYLTELPGTTLNIMVTYNLLAVPKFTLFLKDVLTMRQKMYGNEWDESKRGKLVVDVAYLRWPDYMCVKILDEKWKAKIKDGLDFMEANRMSGDKIFGFIDWEVNKLKVIWHWIKASSADDNHVLKSRALFYEFFTEYDKRKKKDLYKTYPEMTEFFDLCKDASSKNYGTLL